MLLNTCGGSAYGETNNYFIVSVHSVLAAHGFFNKHLAAGFYNMKVEISHSERTIKN